METTPPAALGQSLIYEDLIPARWLAREAGLDRAYYTRLNDNNEEIMRAIVALDDYMPEHMDDQTESPEYRRLELKLNLMIDLLGMLLSQHGSMPPRRMLKLSSSGVEWQETEIPALGSLVLIELYLCPRYPRPLTLPAMVHTLLPQAEGSKIVFVFQEVNERVVEGLERLIFRQHRRQIATARRAALTS